MTDEEFIDAVRRNVFEAAIEDVIKNLASPPGRQPSNASKELSHWYNEQGEETKTKIRKCIEEGAHTALFGLFCVFDGTRLIHEDLRNNKLQLILQKGTEQIILSDNQNISSLHDMFNAEDDVR